MLNFTPVKLGPCIRLATSSVVPEHALALKASSSSPVDAWRPGTTSFWTMLFLVIYPKQGGRFQKLERLLVPDVYRAAFETFN